MNLKYLRKILIPLLVTSIGLGLATIGLDIPRGDIQVVVESQFEEPEPDSGEVIPTIATVRSVTDGDTIVVVQGDQEHRVRIIGINTPEIAGSGREAECYGAEATLKARTLLDGKVVILQTDPTQDTYDTHNRLLAFVAVDGRDFGSEMIAEGFAEEFTYRVPHQRQSEYRAAEAVAKNTGLGLWGSCN